MIMIIIEYIIIIYVFLHNVRVLIADAVPLTMAMFFCSFAFLFMPERLNSLLLPVFRYNDKYSNVKFVNRMYSLHANIIVTVGSEYFKIKIMTIIIVIARP